MSSVDDEKGLVYLHEGDIVQVKHDIPNRPKMIVRRIVKQEDKDGRKYFLGVKCFWFTSEGLYQEQLFSSKDLEICN